MEYYDWLIISFALIMIMFLTLTGLAIFETDLKEKSWFLWFSVGGLIIFIFLTGFLIWFFKGKGTNKKKVEGNNNTGDTKTQDRILINTMKNNQKI